MISLTMATNFVYILETNDFLLHNFNENAAYEIKLKIDFAYPFSSPKYMFGQSS